MENAQKNDTQAKVWKIVKIVLNVIFYAFIVILLLFSIANLKVKNNQSIPNLFGNGFLTVASDSMKGNAKDSFTKDDLIFVKVVTDKNREKKVAKLEIGDIITFVDYDNTLGIILNTHRIVEIMELNDGKTVYITQGDNVGSLNKYVIGGENNADYYETVEANSIKAIYTNKWTNFGKTMKFIQTSTGFMVCIVLPTLIFFLVQVLLVLFNFMKIKQANVQAQLQVEQAELQAQNESNLEAERARIREELLAEMAKENNNKQSESEQEKSEE